MQDELTIPVTLNYLAPFPLNKKAMYIPMALRGYSF